MYTALNYSLTIQNEKKIYRKTGMLLKDKERTPLPHQKKKFDTRVGMNKRQRHYHLNAIYYVGNGKCQITE